MAQWYEELFSNYANRYEQECYIKGTAGEVDFIEKEIGFNKSAAILDIGCGTGRHSIELAKRGYSVTGIDLSDAMLAKAREKAAAEGVTVSFLKRDARDFSFECGFDCAIMLCEGAFPLMETDEMNFAILRNAFQTLKPGGTFIFTTLNGLFPLYHSVRDFILQAAQKGTQTENTFDLITFRDHSIFKTLDDSRQGNRFTVQRTVLRAFRDHLAAYVARIFWYNYLRLCNGRVQQGKKTHDRGFRDAGGGEKTQWLISGYHFLNFSAPIPNSSIFFISHFRSMSRKRDACETLPADFESALRIAAFSAFSRASRSVAFRESAAAGESTIWFKGMSSALIRLPEESTIAF